MKGPKKPIVLLKLQTEKANLRRSRISNSNSSAHRGPSKLAEQQTGDPIKVQHHFSLHIHSPDGISISDPSQQTATTLKTPSSTSTSSLAQIQTQEFPCNISKTTSIIFSKTSTSEKSVINRKPPMASTSTTAQL